jgi:hypothetical protein
VGRAVLGGGVGAAEVVVLVVGVAGDVAGVGAELGAEDDGAAEDDTADGVPSPRVRSQSVSPPATSTTASTAAATTHICRRPIGPRAAPLMNRR